VKTVKYKKMILRIDKIIESIDSENRKAIGLAQYFNSDLKPQEVRFLDLLANDPRRLSNKDRKTAIALLKKAQDDMKNYMDAWGFDVLKQAIIHYNKTRRV